MHGLALLRTLEGEDPLVVLDRIVPRDPLGLGKRCPNWLREHAVLIDPQRLFDATLITIAGEVSLGGLPESDPTWIDQRIARAATSLLHRDAETERGGAPDPNHAEPHRFLLDTFGVAPGNELLASVRFNALPEATRTTFFASVVERRDPVAVAYLASRPVDSVVQDIWEGLLALGLVEEADKASVIQELLGSEPEEGGWR